MPHIKIASLPLTAHIWVFEELFKQKQIEHYSFDREGEAFSLSSNNESDAQKIAQVLKTLEQDSSEFVAVYHSQSFARRALRFSHYPLTSVLIVLGLLGYFVGSWLYASPLFQAMLYMPLSMISVLGFESFWSGGGLWRLVSPAFLHFGWYHILFNSLSMCYLASRLEVYLSKSVFISLFLGLAAFSNMVEYWWSEQIYFGGLSGVVFGYLGFMMSLNIKVENPILDLPRGVIISALLMLFLPLTGLFEGLFGIHLANGAHFGGFVGGIISGTLYGDYRARKIKPASGSHQ